MIEFLTSGLLRASFFDMVVFTLIVTHITIIAVTVYLHRCQAHRALVVKAPLAHFFRFWLWLTTGMSTRAWAAVHRKHHAKCETEDDPHSPQVKGLKKVFFEGAELYTQEANNPDTLQRYGHGTPDDWLENKVYSRFTWHGCGLMLFIDFALFGLPGISIWGIQMLWIPILAAGVINGIGHFWGYRNFDCPDASKNVFPIGLLIGGEELHNNHHCHATSAKLSSKWFEFDVGWCYIRMFECLGLVQVKNVSRPSRFVNRGNQPVNAEVLKGLIAHRYELMARYAATMRKAMRAELNQLLTQTKCSEERSLFKKAKAILLNNKKRLAEEQQHFLTVLSARSVIMSNLVQKRKELCEIWEKGNLSSDQMLVKLQQWCDEAEKSGIHWLQEISARIKSY